MKPKIAKRGNKWFVFGEQFCCSHETPELAWADYEANMFLLDESNKILAVEERYQSGKQLH